MNNKIKDALEKRLELLVKCAETRKHSAEELKAITEAILMIARTDFQSFSAIE